MNSLIVWFFNFIPIKISQMINFCYSLEAHKFEQIFAYSLKIYRKSDDLEQAEFAVLMRLTLFRLISRRLFFHLVNVIRFFDLKFHICLIAETVLRRVGMLLFSPMVHSGMFYSFI